MLKSLSFHSQRVFQLSHQQNAELLCLFIKQWFIHIIMIGQKFIVINPLGLTWDNHGSVYLLRQEPHILRSSTIWHSFHWHVQKGLFVFFSWNVLEKMSEYHGLATPNDYWQRRINWRNYLWKWFSWLLWWVYMTNNK